MSEDLVEIRRELGNLRQAFGGVQVEVRNLNSAITRLEGTVDANQKTNQAAHRAQDDRVAALATQWAARLGAETLKRNLGRGFLTVLASTAGGVAGYLVNVLFGHR